MSSKKDPPESASEKALPGTTIELPELIPAIDALDAVAVHFGGSKAAKDLLVDLMKDGRVRAYALRTWTVEGMAKRQAWRAGAPKDAPIKAQIDPRILAKATLLHLDKERWDWRTGNFYVRRSKTKRTMFRKVRFVAADIHKLVPKKRKAGRPKDQDGRDAIWFAILDILEDGGLTKFKKHKVAVHAVWNALEASWGGADLSAKGETISKMVTDVREHFGLSRTKKEDSV
jgi:hypothetical protein